ncbi:MAG: BMP family ABC transporter substrate-binding protein [Lachnospiraceae bacterium]|nr:BMP family ABC transporter substrate-binding protein [Lachnospiraceae bacterium]
MKKAFLILLAIIVAIAGGTLLIRQRLRADEETQRETRIAVILNGSRDDRSYSQSFYDAMQSYADITGTDVVFRDGISPELFEETVRPLLEEGYWIIIGDHYGYEPYLASLTEAWPESYYLIATGTEASVNHSSFLGRVYQARFLSGIVAGKRTVTGEIGYIIAMPTPETIRQVNAFTIGVRKVNPEAKVHVRFSGDWNDDEKAREATKALLDTHEIDVLSLHVNSLAPLYEGDARGIYLIGNNYDNRELFPKTYLTACVFHWEDFLAERISECERHKFTGRHYWESIKTGTVSLAPLTGNVYFATGDEVEHWRRQILEGEFDVFYGPVTDNYGTVRVREGENLPDDELLYNMHWYVDGVVVE